MGNLKKFKIYTDGNVDKRVYDGENPPDGFYAGSHYKKTPWNKGLTACSDERVRLNVEKAHDTRKSRNYSAWNKGLTKDDPRVKQNISNARATINSRYGVDNISQYLSKQEGYAIWNKGLTKDTDHRMMKASLNHKGVEAWNKGISIKGHPQSVETRCKISEAHTNPDFKLKRYEAMKNNGTLFVSESQAEKDYYSYLKTLYDEDDIIRQYFDKDRYPFKCDFYIKSEDLFIEVNANWTHGGKPYDPNDEGCQKQLSLWEEKSEKSKYYKIAIYTWTDLDVRKLDTANRNNLNFMMIY